MYIYAQLDENNVVMAVSQLSDVVDLPNMVRIETYDRSLIGKKYENGQFVEGPPGPPEARLITVGALKDRLGVNALALSVSTNPICAAMREMLYDRAYVDLDRPDLRSYLMMLVNNNLPESRPEFPGSGPLTEQIVDDVLAGPIQYYEQP